MSAPKGAIMSMLSTGKNTLKLGIFGSFHCHIALFSAAWFGFVTTGCVSTSNSSDNSIAIKDPDPDNDPDAPNLCNPSGKTGAELAKCQEKNNAYFAQFEEEAKKREPWFNFPQDSWLDSTEIDSRYVISPARESEAVNRLEKSSFVELSQIEVRELTGKDMSVPGRKAWLVRGLLYAKDRGAFNVFEKNSSVYVRHEVEGVNPQTEKRSALILWLPYTPKNLYVDCQVIE
jgi:hypothetical protein